MCVGEGGGGVIPDNMGVPSDVLECPVIKQLAHVRAPNSG